jgi:serralysin
MPYFTGDERIDSLLFDSEPHWNGPGVFDTAADLTFSFAQFATPAGIDNDGQAPFTAAQEAAVRSILKAWTNVANLTFAQVTDLGVFTGDSFTRGDLNFANERIVNDDPTSIILGYAFIPDGANPKGSEEQGDVHINDIDRAFDSIQPGGEAYLVLMHEIGHALGLNHPTDGSTTLPDDEVNDRFTVMGPFINENTFADQGVYATTPMLYDILAIQHLYGANTSFHAGADTYTFDDHELIFETIWDAGGRDTIDCSACIRRVVVNLNDGTFSSIGTSPDGLGEDAVNNLAIAFGVSIENAIGGAGSDSLGGNGLVNTLIGNAGLDLISGAGGDDDLRGGKDDDRLVGGNGDDSLNGGSGADVMIGGTGTDKFFVDDVGDVVRGDNGRDSVFSTADFTMHPSVEELFLRGSGDIDGTGSKDKDTILGNIGDNVLRGLKGTDELNGGAGDDVLVGGAGSDKLIGGGGADQLLYTAVTDGAFVAANVVRGGTNGDRAIGFNPGQDQFRFDDAAFDPLGDIGKGALTLGDDFSVIGVAYDGTNPGANANHAAGQAAFIFSTADNTLYYDADGAAAGYTVVATVNVGDVVAASDVRIV